MPPKPPEQTTGTPDAEKIPNFGFVLVETHEIDTVSSAGSVVATSAPSGLSRFAVSHGTPSSDASDGPGSPCGPGGPCTPGSPFTPWAPVSPFTPGTPG